MAKKALGLAIDGHFQSVSLTGEKAINNFSEATINLWKVGLTAFFWPHDSSQTYEYSSIPALLPI